MGAVARLLWRGADGEPMRPSKSTVAVTLVAGAVGIASAIVTLLTP